MYRVNLASKVLEPMRAAALSELGLLERRDLQEWIASCPEILGEDLLIIAKELVLSSGSRLDLLAIDRSGALVVIELKRDGTGNEVNWQAIRYASYCSGLLEEQIVDSFAHYRGTTAEQSRAELDEFIEDGIEQLNASQRIFLCAREFHSDVASGVLWLRDNGLDVTCVKLASYVDARGDIYLNPTTIIPLPEAKDFVIRKEKRDKDHAERRDFSGFYFINVGEGEHRNWDDCCKYGFISAGCGTQYSAPLNRLRAGDKFFAYLTGSGYVGFGKIADLSVPMRDFIILPTGEPLHSQSLAAPKAKEFLNDNERCEYMVRVDWHATLSREDAIPAAGLSVLRGVVKRLRQGHTVEKLKKAFDVNSASAEHHL